MNKRNVHRTVEVPGFVVVKHLGSGARSTIWQVRQHRTGKSFALKRIIKNEASDDRFFQQAANEHAVAQHFDHPVVRKIYRLKRIRRFIRVREIHMLMELCEGATLQDKRPQEIDEIIGIFLKVADGISHINSRGFIHADIKPNNIVVGPDGEVKIIDLGHSCSIGKIKTRVQGTPDYIAPEQAERRPLDVRTDVFNLGATMYWVLTGQAIPTVLPKGDGVMLKQDMSITPPEILNPAVPLPLSKLVIECVELLPRRRPQAIKAVTARLELCRHALSRRSSWPIIELPPE